MPVYRSVRLVIQNSTSATLSVEAAEVLQGQWRSADGLIMRGASIAPQSAALIDCWSERLQVGCEAFLRLSSVSGVVHVHWSLPWVGSFRLHPELDGQRWHHELILLEESPASPAALLILEPARTAVQPLARRRRG